MIAAIIQARMGSSRLFGKVLMDLNGKPVIWHVISRVSKAEYLDKTIVATTINTEDDAIVDFCNRQNIPVFRGSENDVLDRFYWCAKSFNISDIVRVTADCPMHDPQVIDYVIGEYRKGGYDYVTNTLEYTYPDGLDVEVFSFHSLEDAWKNAKLGSEREHVTPYIRNSLSMKKKNVYAPKKYPIYRFTLDTREDFLFISKIFEGIGADIFGLEDILDYLDTHPDLLTINQYIASNEGYFKSLIDDAKNVVLQTDRLYLRQLLLTDASETYCQWLNNPEVNRFLETKRTSVNELKQYIAEKWESNECVFFGIFLKETNVHIGNIKLEPIVFDKNEATIGIMIGNPMWWGKGICTEAVKSVVNYAFSTMNLHKIGLGVVLENTAAINCYKNAGFSIEKTEPLTGVNATRDRQKFIMSILNIKDETGE